MGYHVYILRSASGKAVPIGEAEVRQAVTRMAGRLALMSDGPELCLYQPALGDESEILVFSDDELWAKNPSEPMLALMIELAGYLDARVRGEELETYRTVDDTYLHPDDRALAERYPPPRPGGMLSSPAVREMAARLRVAFIFFVLAGGAAFLHRYLSAGHP